MLSCTPSPWRTGARGAGRIVVLWGPSASHRVSPALGPQILPQEEDYGFDIEEKNKAVVVKSVQRGSLAEVRPPRGATHSVHGSSLLVVLWAHSGQGGLPCVL